MVVRSILRVPEVRVHAQSLEDLPASVGALPSTPISEPEEANVARLIKTAWGDEASKLVMVDGEEADSVVILAKVVEGFGEPYLQVDVS